VEPSSAPWRVLEAADPEPPAPAPERAGAIQWPVIAAIAVAAAVAIAALLVATRSSGGLTVEAPSIAVATASAGVVGPRPSPSAEVLVVDVGGAVRNPGVYRLPSGSRVGDAIAAAGGFGARVDADLADRMLNLAAVVHDGDEIHVPARGEAPLAGAPAGGAGSPASGGPIDLNRATAEQLDTLPGIGPVTAAKIIAAREEQPFASVDDLGTRKVVGSSTLDKIRALVTVGP
jgi:competence protein ComEA